MTAMTLEQSRDTSRSAVRANWRLYAIEAALVGCLLLVTCAIVAVMAHPSSPVAVAVPDGLVRRALTGVCIALTVVCIVYSPLGRRTGPHLNPAMTLTFLRLGRIAPRDAAGFIAGQFIGGALGVLLAAVLLGGAAHDTHYAVNTPGPYGVLPAWVAEFAIALLLVCVVFTVNKSRLVKFTGCFAAGLTWTYITFESPISGTGVNAARTFASSLFSNIWTGWWIYFTAPPLGMLTGVELLRLLGRKQESLCGKLAHDPTCFFKCNCVQQATERRGQS
jgi:aquaporin Z